jgi:hypothetical protein
MADSILSPPEIVSLLSQFCLLEPGTSSPAAHTAVPDGQRTIPVVG